MVLAVFAAISVRPAAADNEITFPITHWTPPPPPLAFPPSAPPELQVKGPGKVKTVYKKAPATFRFFAPLSLSLECTVDGGKSFTCVSPFTTRRLPVGFHHLSVRGTDAGGRQTLVTKFFTIAKKQ